MRRQTTGQRFGVVLGLALLALALLPAVGRADPVTIFSGSGFVTPESITLIPSGFGSVGGDYFVPDLSTHELFVLPSGGGAPTAFADLPYTTGYAVSQGLFVPAGYGSLSGDYLVTGNGLAASVNSSGSVTDLSLSNFVGGDTVAPAGFGAVGGKVLLGNEEADGTVDILALNADGTTTVFATLGIRNSQGSPFAAHMGFAPAGFGAIGGDLVVSDEDSGNVYAINALGEVSLFATLPVPTVNGQITGLRDLAFAPAGYGAYGGDLFISVSGSQAGGGYSGSVDVLNSSGAYAAFLPEGTVGMPFDPRGLYFVNSDQLLVADTDPGILSVEPDAFAAVTPEPSSISLLLLGLLGVAVGRERARRFGSEMDRI
jgi:hypothetical protein